MTQRTAHIGVLIHGRHLQSKGWEQMVWSGQDASRLGTLPTAILAILDERLSEVSMITFGTGASHDSNGTLEAEVTKRFFIEKFDHLDDFPIIADHPCWPTEKEAIRRLVMASSTDIVSQNTVEEIACAAELFTQHHITRVIEVTGASHGPRCQLMQNVARASSVIPATQQWHLVTDDIAYYNTEAGDTLVFEEPHRSDDPFLNVPARLRPAKLFRKFFMVPKEKQVAFLEEVAQLMKRYI